ncbi:MarR family winged helix-turn-helix transcriptional regulator [Virgibacillus flavescens]|uniref:MarR family winged helix-turn-helix transcriptional regulator n=1 Tax=Virgibacillus flavescens TaxID=1611422 RepID=UPI003D328444
MKEPDNLERQSSSSLKLFVVLTRALQAIENEVVKDIKSHGLSLTEFSVMELLYNKGQQPIQKIGKKILLASSSTTYVVDKLEGKQLLERKDSPNDRRIKYAALTMDGEKIMKQIFPKHVDAMNDIMGGLSTDEKEDMIMQLKKLGYHALGR